MDACGLKFLKGVDNIPTNAAQLFFNQNYLALMTVHYFKRNMPNLENDKQFSLKERRFLIEAELESKMGFTSELLEVLEIETSIFFIAPTDLFSIRNVPLRR